MTATQTVTVNYCRHAKLANIYNFIQITVNQYDLEYKYSHHIHTYMNTHQNLQTRPSQSWDIVHLLKLMESHDMFSGIECRCFCQALIYIPHLATNQQWQMLHRTLSSRQTAEVIVVTQHQEHRPHTGSPDSSLFIIAMATTGDRKTMYLSASAHVQSVSPTQSYRKLLQNIKYRLRLLLNTHLKSSHIHTYTHTHQNQTPSH